MQIMQQMQMIVQPFIFNVEIRVRMIVVGPRHIVGLLVQVNVLLYKSQIIHQITHYTIFHSQTQSMDIIQLQIQVIVIK